MKNGFGNNNKIYINNVNIIVKKSFSKELGDNFNISKEMNMDKNDYKINQLYKSVEIGDYDRQQFPEFLTRFKIIVKNENFIDIEMQVNSSDSIRDIIEKYKTKLQNDRIKNVYFTQDEGRVISPELTISEAGLVDNSVVHAVCEEDNSNNNVISKERIEKIKTIIKQKQKEGLITIIIESALLGSDFYYVNPKVKFKAVAEQFKLKNTGHNWAFLFNAQVINEEKTLEELKFKMFSKIIALEI